MNFKASICNKQYKITDH